MLRVALIGLGMAVEPHARSLLDLNDRIEVRWAASRSQARIEAFGQRFPFPVTCDVRAAITDPQVDAVFLLTPPNTHYDLAVLALAYGKHLLVEKPLAADIACAEQIVKAARAADVRLGVVLQHRFRPAAQRLRSVLAAGLLGPPQFATATVPWWRPQSYYDEPGRGTLARDGGGVLITQAIHTLDLFRTLVGPLDVIACRASSTALHAMETEDHVSALLALPGGGTATLQATTSFYPGHPARIEVVGQKGGAVLSGGALVVRWLDGRTELVEDEGQTGAGAQAMDFSNDAHRMLVADFCRAVEDGRTPEASGDEALATQQLINGLLQAAGPIRRLSTPPPSDGHTSLETLL
jgi:predicted dehydrogenase